MYPLLRILAGHPQGLRSSEAAPLVADLVGLSEVERGELLPSGRQAVYRNRIGWAHDRLKRAGLSSAPRRGFWQITEEGQLRPARPPSRVPGRVSGSSPTGTKVVRTFGQLWSRVSRKSGLWPRQSVRTFGQL
ncbi:MAG: winged helix-turn-helix domain-containing protein [Planctomycetota bacterium]